MTLHTDRHFEGELQTLQQLLLRMGGLVEQQIARAIEALVEHRARLLVVQATGWGKSVVYFIAARQLREQGAGPTLLVSPLLSLMRDQVRSVRRAPGSGPTPAAASS